MASGSSPGLVVGVLGLGTLPYSMRCTGHGTTLAIIGLIACSSLGWDKSFPLLGSLHRAAISLATTAEISNGLVRAYAMYF